MIWHSEKSSKTENNIELNLKIKNLMNSPGILRIQRLLRVNNLIFLYTNKKNLEMIILKLSTPKPPNFTFALMVTHVLFDHTTIFVLEIIKDSINII